MACDKIKKHTRHLKVLLWFYALLFICYALFYTGFIENLLFTGTFNIHRIQIICFSLSILFILIAQRFLFIPFLQKLLANETTVNVLLSIFSVVFFISFLEAAFRPFTHFGYRDAAIFQQSPTLEWELRHSYETQYGGVNVRMNEFGMRGDSIKTNKNDGVKRYLFIGDSVTFGLRLEEKDTIPVNVEARLNQQSGFLVQCLNAGVPGYSVLQSRIALEEKGKQLKPDAVVFGFVLNDVLPTYTAENYQDFGSDNPVPYIQRNWFDWVHQNSSIAYMVKKAYYNLRFGRSLHESAVYQEQLDVQSLIHRPEHPEIENAWLSVQKNIELIQKWCDKNNANFYVVLYPYRSQLRSPDGANAPQEKMKEIAAEVAVLDMMPIIVNDMKNNNRQPEDYFMDFCHPTAWGAGWMAIHISSFLIERESLKG